MTNSLDALAQGNEDDYDEDEDDDDEDDSQEEDCSDDIDINGGGGESNGMANSNGNSSSKMTDLSKLLDPAYSAYFEVCLLSGVFRDWVAAKMSRIFPIAHAPYHQNGQIMKM